MSVSVVAVLTGRAGQGPRIIDAYREVSPLVHRERGCELYAANLEQDGDTVVLVERWAGAEDLRAHAEGAALVRLDQLLEGALEMPYQVWVMDEVPIGDPSKGVVPRPA
jgi:quinol monooxygenase YgiN